MIQAIGPIGGVEDPEYKRIIEELRKLGIRPTGNKQIDKTRLTEIKSKQAEKVLESQIQKSSDDNTDKEREQLERVKVGAMQLAELNKILLNIN